MTKQEAARILRTERIGDSEQMELAKQMGAQALDTLPGTFIVPKCAHCGHYLLALSIQHIDSIGDVVVGSKINPEMCPKCGTYFVRLDLDYENEVCIARGEEDLTNAT